MKHQRPQSGISSKGDLLSEKSKILNDRKDGGLDYKSIMEIAREPDLLSNPDSHLSPMRARRPMSAKVELGIEGYKVPKSLALYNPPSYSIKKDKSDFFDQETKEQRKNPGPGTYTLRHVLTKQEEAELIRKRREKIDKDKLPKRPFFMDEMVQRMKHMPAPGQYTPKRTLPVKGNVEMKLDRVSYLDEAIRDKQDSMGPGHYKPKRDIVQKRPSSAKWATPKKQDWHIKKNEDAPDVGSYDVQTSKKYVMKTVQAPKISATNILNFSGQMAKDKAYIPPAGTYQPEKCYSFISRSGMRKRV